MVRIEADEVSFQLRKLEFSHAFASGTRLAGRWSFRQWTRKGEEIFQREKIVAANQSLPIRLAQLFCSHPAPKPTFRFHGFPHRVHVMARGKFKGKPKRGGKYPPPCSNDAYTLQVGSISHGISLHWDQMVKNQTSSHLHQINGMYNFLLQCF